MKAMAGFATIGMTMLLGACAGAPVDSSSAPAIAQSSATATAPSAAPAPPAATPAQGGAETSARLDPNEKICRRQQTTGSRFAETRCQTRYEWEVEERLARKQIEESRKGAPPPTN
ncbi:MAG TPA: hypothetical protein PK681_12845 [Steroidobacteraceae bacterium]|nr:hypothetical protein [Steroidobacteraceae bacterium]HQW08759.1 hypothetical protein [Steroidobacteraceae bacterium]HQX47675.1 hypothetical protein [Steroidobacteraceae bacterium]HQX79960.1 hypothetical protein [Steroidobacteraceae bacterium]HQZ81495.1 hypothetical protein [Steroidobacteraceae bacterium]